MPRLKPKSSSPSIERKVVNKAIKWRDMSKARALEKSAAGRRHEAYQAELKGDKKTATRKRSVADREAAAAEKIRGPKQQKGGSW